MTSPFYTFEDIESLCANAVAENLQLEFKEKEDRSTSTLSRTDKKQIAEALSSFANSDGGTLIFGIRSERRGDSDIASELKPIADAASFASNLRMVCSLNVSPSLVPTDVRPILSPGSTGGFVVCEIARSNARPHMSTAPGIHSYFRRSFQGNVPMTPSEVRDQILAVRDAILEPVIKYPAGGMFSMGYNWVSGRTSVVIALKNVGQALCRNPFLRVTSDTKLHSNSATFDGALGAWKTTFPYGTLIHVDDQESCLTLAFDIAVRFDILHQLFEAHASDFSESVLILPAADSYRLQTITDKISLDEIRLRLKFGAENAPVVDSAVTLTRSKIASGVLSQDAVRDFYMQNIGAWRSDLLQRSIATAE